MPQPGDDPRHLDIRKYPNRRFYDATRSRHVTLEEIHTLIRDGYDVTVTDSRSGADITGKVLAQIILELDPPKLDIFPNQLLHRLIRSNQSLVTDFVEKYFNQALAAFLDSQRQVEQRLRSSLGLGAGVPTMADWSRLMMGPLAGRALWPTPPGPAGAGSSDAGPRGGEPEGRPGDGDAGLREVVRGLRAQVAELRRELGARPKRRSRRR